MRFLFPWPATPRSRCRMNALGSDDAHLIICSSLIAQAFDAVHYPILPKITHVGDAMTRREIAENRHSSLYTPRDFDISPYFMVVKPTIARGFNYKDMVWTDPLPDHARWSASAFKDRELKVRVRSLEWAQPTKSIASLG
jgi:hypothetical protein